MGKNAGKPLSNDAVFISVEDIRTVLDRNLMTCILCCREIAPEMIARKSGCIVNIGSISGLSGHAAEAIYSTAKAAVHEYSRCLARNCGRIISASTSLPRPDYYAPVPRQPSHR